MLAGALHSARSALPGRSAVEVVLICRRVLQPLFPAQPCVRFWLPEERSSSYSRVFLEFRQSHGEIPGRGRRSSLANPISRSPVPWATDVGFGWGQKSKGRGLKGCGRYSLGSGATESIAQVYTDTPHFHTQAYTPHSHFSPVQPMGRVWWVRFLIAHGNFDSGHLEEGEQS